MGLAHWGLLPPWTQTDDKASCAKMINARSETVAEKPAFRQAWESGRRCLIPASGFFEWKTDEKAGVNQPYYIADANESCLAFAGLWNKTGNLVTFTILTKDADGPIVTLHHRMPVILKPGQAAAWFAATPDDAMHMIKAASGAGLFYHPVGSAVGKVANDDPSLLEKAQPLASGLLF